MAAPTVRPITYFLVFAALIALTLLTVAVSFVHLGKWHAAVGLSIAAVKIVLVALFFMHLLHGTRITWLAVGATLVWLAILFHLTWMDYSTRIRGVY